MSCSNSNDQENEPVQDQEPTGEVANDSLVRAIYRNHCGGCHGQNLESFVERDWQHGESYEMVLNSIRNGYEGNGMPAYGNTFTSAELEGLTNYILTEIEGKTKASLLEDNPNLSGVISSDDMDFRVETLTDQVGSNPWGIAQLPSGELIVTEKGGRLYKISLENELTEITGIPTSTTNNQGGLLDVHLHPNFSSNQYVYLSYTKSNPENNSQTTTAVARGRLQENELTEVEDIFIAQPYSSASLHYGSRLLFDTEGYLYVTVGDRGRRDDFPQVLDNQCGKVHRLNDDGSIPTDNPFINTNDAYGSIFSYGIRNPQGLSLHPETGAVWEGEHGPQGGDEINILEAGNNYGWPVISYGINYDGTTFTDITEQDGMEQPVHYWTPSIAPCGMDFVSGSFYSGWSNDLFVGSLKFEYLHRLKMNGNEVVGEEELLNDIGRVRDVLMGNDGYLYIAVQSPGRVIRLVPEN